MWPCQLPIPAPGVLRARQWVARGAQAVILFGYSRVNKGNGGFNASMLRSHIDDAQRSEILGKDRLVFTNGKKATEYMKLSKK